MRFYKREATEQAAAKVTPDTTTPVMTPPRRHSKSVSADTIPQGRVPAIAVVLGAVASIGGFICTYGRDIHRTDTFLPSDMSYFDTLLFLFVMFLHARRS